MAHKILQFTGKGYGFMSGVTEYIVIVPDGELDDDDLEPAPGFKFEQYVEFDDTGHGNLSILPLKQMLVKKF